MSDPAILVIDQGTTGTGVALIDQQGRFVAQSDHEFRQYYPQPGWVEHDPEEIWQTVALGIAEVLAAAGDTFRPMALAITNQRETVVLWDRHTGRPLARAIVWQDRRTADICNHLRADGVEEAVRATTGLLLDPYFSATKIGWLLDHVAGARERAQRGELAAGTIDSWLIWKLTGGLTHVTDRTNASRTLLYSLDKESWDDDLCRLFDIPHSLLPRVVPSSGVCGLSQPVMTHGLSLPIAGVAGDQQAALAGQACFEDGEAKNTYGTGCFLLVHTGTRRKIPRGKLLLTAAVGKLPNGQPGPGYAIEGSVFIAGAAIQWLRDELQVIRSAVESEAVASSVVDSGGVYIVPAFTGLGAPYWDPYARGTIVGLTRGSNRGHLVRATLESIAFQTADLVRAVEAESVMLSALRVDGGGTANGLLMQIQADLLGMPVERSGIQETTSWGAAILAGLGTGLLTSIDACRRLWRLDRRFEPSMPDGTRERCYRGWCRAVQRAQGWVEAD